ncbi:MAG: hypothetical protein ACLQUT_06915 [Thermoleophilia bacterium]
MKIATQMATIQQDETPVIIAFWIDQLRAVSTKVHNVGGPGSVWIDFSKTYIS